MVNLSACTSPERTHILPSVAQLLELGQRARGGWRSCEVIAHAMCDMGLDCGLWWFIFPDDYYLLGRHVDICPDVHTLTPVPLERLIITNPRGISIR